MADVISEEDFRAEARAFLDANADASGPRQKFEWGEGSDKVALFEEKTPRAGAAEVDAAKAWRAEDVRRRLRLDHRARPSTAAASCPAPTSGVYARPRGAVRTSRTRASSASASAWWRRRSWPTPPPRCKRALPAPAVPRRHRRLPAVQRARRRLRPRRPADQGRARRRRVGHHRPEGVDVGRAVQRHRRDHLPHRPRPAQAQGPHRLRRRHARARRRGAAAAPDDRRRVVQRGVLQRGARARRPPPRRRQRGLDRRAHHADERAGVDRRRRRRRRGGGQRHPRSSRWCRHFGLDDDPIVRQQLADVYIALAGRRATRTSGRWTRSSAGQLPGPGDVDRQAGAHQQHAAHRRVRRPTCSARGSSPTPASGAPTRGRSSCSACPACASPAAPTRSCATSSASGCSACPRSPSPPSSS